MPSCTSPLVSVSGLPISRVMRSAISSLRLLMRSPIRRITSPRAGAGVARQISNPRRADSTARSTSAAPESGNRPIVSDRSAGFLFSKYSPLIGGTQSPPMKFLKVFIENDGTVERWNGGTLTVPPSLTRPDRWVRGIGLRVADTRQDFDGAEHEAPQNQ